MQQTYFNNNNTTSDYGMNYYWQLLCISSHFLLLLKKKRKNIECIKLSKFSPCELTKLKFFAVAENPIIAKYTYYTRLNVEYSNEIRSF